MKHAGLNAEARKDEFHMQLPGIEKETVIDSPDMDAEPKRGRERAIQKPLPDLIPGIMLAVLNTPKSAEMNGNACRMRPSWQLNGHSTI